jgi:hypothetical protein
MKKQKHLTRIEHIRNKLHKRSAAMIPVTISITDFKKLKRWGKKGQKFHVLRGNEKIV